MQKRTTALTAILALALIAIISAGATLAYLTDRDSTETITYTIAPDAELTIELHEPIWKAGNKGQPGFFDAQGKAIFSAERKVIKDPEIHVQEGSVDCYVRLYVQIDKKLAAVIETPEPYENWIRRPIKSETSKEYEEYYYYYPTKMKAGEKTPRAFDFIEFRNPRANGQTAETFFKDASDKSIIVTGQAIQAEGFATWDKAPWDELEKAYDKK